jgi:hypothetical protein
VIFQQLQSTGSCAFYSKSGGNNRHHHCHSTLHQHLFYLHHHSLQMSIVTILFFTISRGYVTPQLPSSPFLCVMIALYLPHTLHHTSHTSNPCASHTKCSDVSLSSAGTLLIQDCLTFNVQLPSLSNLYPKYYRYWRESRVPHFNSSLLSHYPRHDHAQKPFSVHYLTLF